MGKPPNPSRTNRTRTQVLPRTEPKPKSQKCARTRAKPCIIKNQTEPEPKFHGSYSVLSLNEIVGTFMHFTSKRGILLYLG